MGYSSTTNRVIESGESALINLSAGTALIKTGSGNLIGVTVNSHTSGTLIFRDGTTVAGSLMHGTITLAADERSIDFRGEAFSNGLFVTVGGTADVTIQYK